MTERSENARAGIAVPAQAVETGAASRQATTSCEQHTTAAAGRQMSISDFLLRGAENAIPLRHLKQLTGLPGRDIRRRIEAERRRGVPICADCKSGYFLPDGEAEKARCVRSMRGRAKEILLTVAAIEKGESYTY